jgi:hypothetical protein
MTLSNSIKIEITTYKHKIAIPARKPINPLNRINVDLTKIIRSRVWQINPEIKSFKPIKQTLIQIFSHEIILAGHLALSN